MDTGHCQAPLQPLVYTGCRLGCKLEDTKTAKLLIKAPNRAETTQHIKATVWNI